MAFFNLRLTTEATLLVDSDPGDSISEHFGTVICIDGESGDEPLPGERFRILRRQRGGQFRSGGYDECVPDHLRSLRADYSAFPTSGASLVAPKPTLGSV